MRKLLATTCIVALSAMPVMAQTADTTAPADTTTMAEGGASNDMFMEVQGDQAMLASDIIGKRVYATETGIESDSVNEASADWDNLGDINDIIVSTDGGIEAVLVDIGGFLGIGAKTVAVQMDQLTMVSDGDSVDDFFIVLNASRDMIENAPEFRVGDIEDGTVGTEAAVDSAATETEQTADPAVAETDQATDSVATETDQMAGSNMDGFGTAPMIERDGYANVMADDLTADDLTGAAVYDANDEWIGDVANLVLTSDGQVQEAVIDVGGFLGIGEKPVAVSLENMTLTKSTDGDDLRVYVDTTKERLEAMPDYEG